MKELEKQIEQSKRRMEAEITEYENCDPNDERRLRAILTMIKRWESYIKGLEDAKKYIEMESE